MIRRMKSICPLQLGVGVIMGVMLISLLTAPPAMLANEFTSESVQPARTETSRFHEAGELHDYFMEPIEEGYWLDAWANGVNLGLSGFQVYTSAFLQFDFPFYDSLFDTVYVSNNGYLSFADSSPTENVYPHLPSSNPSHALTIAPFWRFMPGTSNIFMWNTSEFCVFQYNNSYYYSGPEAGTFQVVLYSNGTIDFNYLEMVTVFESTTGLNYGDGEYFNLFPYEELEGVTNFTLRFTYYAEGADLEVRLHGPQYTLVGSTYQFNATAKNLGSTTETNLQISVYLDSTLVQFTTIGSLGPVENFTLTYSFMQSVEKLCRLEATIEQVSGEFRYENNHDELLIITSIERDYAIFQDQVPWGFSSITDVLSKYGISYDIYGSSSMGVVDLSNYTRAIIVSNQPASYRQRVYDNLTWFKDYVIAGGILEIHAADQQSSPWVNGELPCNVSYEFATENFVTITTPWHQIYNAPHAIPDEELDEWNSAVHGHFVNITPAYQELLVTAMGFPALIEFPFGNGHFIATTQTVEWGYGQGYSIMLENLLLYRPIKLEHDLVAGLAVPFYSPLGEAVDVEFSVMNWGEEPVEYNVGVTVTANGESIYSDTISAVSNSTPYIEEFQWTPAFEGMYTITVGVEPVEGEVELENNEVSKTVYIRSELGRILWDEGHGCISASYFENYFKALERAGFRVDTTNERINETILSDYSAFVCAEPQTNYWSNETDALQAFVLGGGGFFAIGDSFQAPLNNLTLFAGIEWLAIASGGVTTNITAHAVTEGVEEILFPSPMCAFNLTGTAIPLAYLSNYPVLAVSEIGAGRVAAIADEDPLGIYDFSESDNAVLGINIITWLTEGRQYNEISNVVQTPTSVYPTDTVTITCNVIDLHGVAMVEVIYRVDGGAWQSVMMSLVTGDTYSGEIPAQLPGAFVEYYIKATNTLDIIGLEDNDGELYNYTVLGPTTTTTTSTTTTTTTELPPDMTVLLLAALGVGGAVILIVVVFFMKRKSVGD